jgi:hypothetical protein
MKMRIESRGNALAGKPKLLRRVWWHLSAGCARAVAGRALQVWELTLSGMFTFEPRTLAAVAEGDDLDHACIFVDAVEERVVAVVGAPDFVALGGRHGLRDWEATRPLAEAAEKFEKAQEPVIKPVLRSTLIAEIRQLLSDGVLDLLGEIEFIPRH